jgi:hypothetical protein
MTELQSLKQKLRIRDELYENARRDAVHLQLAVEKRDATIAELEERLRATADLPRPRKVA